MPETTGKQQPRFKNGDRVQRSDDKAWVGTVTDDDPGENEEFDDTYTEVTWDNGEFGLYLTSDLEPEFML